MNLDTGELFMLNEIQNEMLARRMLLEIPPELQEEAQAVAAKAAVAGERPVVSLDGNTPLSQWRLDQLRQRGKQRARRRRNNKQARRAKRR